VLVVSGIVHPWVDVQYSGYAFANTKSKSSVAVKTTHARLHHFIVDIYYNFNIFIHKVRWPTLIVTYFLIPVQLVAIQAALFTSSHHLICQRLAKGIHPFVKQLRARGQAKAINDPLIRT